MTDTNHRMNYPSKKKTIYFFIIMMVITTITYLNHFDNSFHFDDSHAIVQNPSIRSLKNIPYFFKDANASSVLPQNQSYRPILTTTLAFDYWIAQEYNVLYFHSTSFIFFLLLGILIYVMSFKILNITTANLKNNFYLACSISLLYMIHPVMAETVNYIIARSDLLATFFVVLTFVIYQHSTFSKKYYLYLIPFVLGTLAKPIAIMFGPLLLYYILLFEKGMSIQQCFKRDSFIQLKQVFLKTTPIWIITVLLYVFINRMTPDSYISGFTSIYNYIITQPFVITYYLGSLFFPIGLSADTDWLPLESIWSYEFFIGALVILGLLILIYITSKKRKHHPISFGVFWFLIALIPTSSFIPLSEVMNSQRMFFPYVGLIISIGYSFYLGFQYLINKYSLNPIYGIILTSSLFVLFAFGTYNRNEVWHNDESLWKDVTLKSPKNARGHMNYGHSQMKYEKYDIAEKHFKTALEINPNYHKIHINLGVLYNVLGKTEQAEEYFKNALKLSPKYYFPWFYYGRFLTNKNRHKEAIKTLSESIKLTPTHLESRLLLMQNYRELEEWDLLADLAKHTLEISPNNARAKRFLLASKEKKSELLVEESEIDKNPNSNEYINLSLKYYYKKQYENCIRVSNKALKITPNAEIPYNNICSAEVKLGNFQNAINACNNAIKIKPDFELAQNNLKDAIHKNNTLQNFLTSINAEPTEGNYLNLSLFFYQNKLFENCINITKQGIEKNPTSDKLYNNLCSGYNALRNWTKAIEAGTKGLKINPNNQRLQNNYKIALQNNQLKSSK